MKHHHAVVHPDVLIARAETEFHGLLALNDRLLNWMAAHVLPSMLMFDMALVLPLLVIPAPDGVKILVGLLSGSWFQWWHSRRCSARPTWYRHRTMPKLRSTTPRSVTSHTSKTNNLQSSSA